MLLDNKNGTYRPDETFINQNQLSIIVLKSTGKKFITWGKLKEFINGSLFDY